MTTDLEKSTLEVVKLVASWMNDHYQAIESLLQNVSLANNWLGGRIATGDLVYIQVNDYSIAKGTFPDGAEVYRLNYPEALVQFLMQLLLGEMQDVLRSMTVTIRADEPATTRSIMLQVAMDCLLVEGRAPQQSDVVTTRSLLGLATDEQIESYIRVGATEMYESILARIS